MAVGSGAANNFLGMTGVEIKEVRLHPLLPPEDTLLIMETACTVVTQCEMF